jgi:hypothetical protein
MPSNKSTPPAAPQPELEYFLNRPLPALTPFGPEKLEAAMLAVLHLCHAAREGGTVVVSASWQAESVVHRVVWLASHRWRMAGGGELEIMVDAPGLIHPTGKRRVTMLLGLDDDWRSAGIDPAFHIGDLGAAIDDRIEPLRRHLARNWSRAPDRIRQAVLLNAFGVDAPGCIFAGGQPDPLFWPIAGTADYSLAGQWLAWAAIRENRDLHFHQTLARVREWLASRHPHLLLRLDLRLQLRGMGHLTPAPASGYRGCPPESDAG